jgi:hypothetical protein
MATSSDSIIPGGGGFRECLRQIRRKTLKAGAGLLNIVSRQANVG